MFTIEITHCNVTDNYLIETCSMLKIMVGRREINGKTILEFPSLESFNLLKGTLTLMFKDDFKFDFIPKYNNPSKNSLIESLINLRLTWWDKEVTEDVYNEMLGALPPKAMSKDAFLVGEIADHNKFGLPLYDCFYNKDDRYFYFGRMTIGKFKEIF